MKALDVAAHIINHCIEIGNPITNLKLQKILYFLDMTYLVNAGDRLIEDYFEAWQYGPVIKEIYNKYSSYAASAIELKQEFQEDLPEEYKKRIINKIESLANTRAWDLVDISHEKGSPWDITYNGGLGNHKIIDNSLLLKNAQEIKARQNDQS